MTQNIEVVTKRGVSLDGILFGSNNETVLIAITGVHGNLYSNPFYYNIGQTLPQNGIDFIYAQTNDAFSKVEIMNKVTNELETVGSYNEDFKDSCEDVDAYIEYAKSLGYKHIILAGHSLGANKVIYYLSTHHECDIEHFIIISPAELKYMISYLSPKQIEIIKEYSQTKDPNTMLPFDVFGWLPATAKTACMWISDDTLDNVHTRKNGDYTQIEQITQTGAFIIGGYDAFSEGDAEKFIENINNHTKNKDENKIIIIEETGHTYQQKEQKLADTLLEILRNWGY